MTIHAKQMWKEEAHKNALWDSYKLKGGFLEPPAGHILLINVTLK